MTLFDQVPLLLRVWALQVEPAGAQKLRLKGSRDQKWHQKGPPKGAWNPKVAMIGSEGTILELILIRFCDFLPAWLSIHLTVSNFETLWTHLVPESIKIQGFRESFWWHFGGRVKKWKWVFRVGETLILKKSFFSCLGWLFCDFGRFWGGLGGHFGIQRATKMASKIDQKNEWFLDRSWKRSGAPKGGLRILRSDGKGPRGGVRGGVNPPLREGLRIIYYNF